MGRRDAVSVCGSPLSRPVRAAIRLADLRLGQGTRVLCTLFSAETWRRVAPKTLPLYRSPLP